MIAASSVLVSLALVLAVTDLRATSAQETAAVAQKRLIEVGKTSTFRLGIPQVRCKVIEAPRDKWVRVEFLDKERPPKAWNNLDLVLVILDEA